MSSQRQSESDPEHPILAKASEFKVVGLHLEKTPVDGTEPLLDLMAQRNGERRVLRFWSPSDLEIERGGPTMTWGLIIRDISARGLEKIGVEVDDGTEARSRVPSRSVVS
jgi:hypothetical protein